MSWLVETDNAVLDDLQGKPHKLQGEYLVTAYDTKPIAFAMIWGPIDRTPITDPAEIAKLLAEPAHARPIPFVGHFKTFDVKMAISSGALMLRPYDEG